MITSKIVVIPTLSQFGLNGCFFDKKLNDINLNSSPNHANLNGVRKIVTKISQKHTNMEISMVRGLAEGLRKACGMLAEGLRTLIIKARTKYIEI